MWGLLSILSLFSNKFNKLNDTGARLLDSVNHMTLKLLWNQVFLHEKAKIFPYKGNINTDVNTDGYQNL